MSVLFRIVYASKCNGTHHKLAMDALRYVSVPESEAWIRLFLKHADSYIEGSKAPDKRFKDFRNHVLHVKDNNWGGAVKTAERWYNEALMALHQRRWKEFAYATGVLSHYYTDPIMPFHTAQSEEETQIHRAVEWSLNKSYDKLFALYEAEYEQQTKLPHTANRGAEFVKTMVLEGANLSYHDYHETIEHYNFDLGVQTPTEGLDAVLREKYAKLLGYAARGFARILEELIQHGGITPPDISLSLESALAGVTIPMRWVTRKISNRQERLQVEAIYQEYLETGRVKQNLPEDDRLIRKMHAEEVLQKTVSQLDQQFLGPLGAAYGRGGNSQKTNFVNLPKRNLETHLERKHANQVGVVTTIEVLGEKQKGGEKLFPKLERTSTQNKFKTAESPVRFDQKRTKFLREPKREIQTAETSSKPRIRVKSETETAVSHYDTPALIVTSSTFDEQSPVPTAKSNIQVARPTDTNKRRAEEERLKEIERRELARQELAQKELSRQESERIEQERRDFEHQKLARREEERLRLESERLAQQRHETERRESERLERERRETERRESERLERERRESERRESERLKREQRDYDRIDSGARDQDSGQRDNERRRSRRDDSQRTESQSSSSRREGSRSGDSQYDHSRSRDSRRSDSRTREMQSRETYSIKSAEQSQVPASPEKSKQKPVKKERLKYYLQRSDPVVDAPTIGPKTAKRLHKVGIKTIDDLFNCDPDDIAAKIGMRNITPDDIRDWQDQSELVCRIPNLRGHDAQILVYSGVRKVEHLEGWQPKTLLEMVDPFVKSKAGVRLLRGSGQPDLEEVTDWLRWSGVSRPLRAA